MSWPEIVIVPLVGSSRPATIRSVVVLPQPGRAEQGEELALLDDEVELVDRDEGAELLGDGGERQVCPRVVVRVRPDRT